MPRPFRKPDRVALPVIPAFLQKDGEVRQEKVLKLRTNLGKKRPHLNTRWEPGSGDTCL